MKYQINNKLFITDNSLECDENTIFLETKTSHKYKSNAIANGCKEVITPKSLNKYFKNNIKVVGITGTNGKTTTAAIIYSLLLDLGYKVAMQGTRGLFINDKKVEGKSLTTPQVLSNHYNIHQACEQDCDFFIMEVSSHAIEQERIASIDYELKILTNITSDHLDYHGSIEEYVAIKNSFFKEAKLKLFNSDEKNFIENTGNARSYSIEGVGTYKLEAYSFNNGLSGIIGFAGEQEAFTSPLIGYFNLSNILAAVGATHILSSKPLKEICENVENFAGVSGRMEVVSTEPFIFVDFAHTEDGVLQVLKSIEGMRVVTVIGAGGDRDRSKREKMGKTAGFYSVRTYVTSDNPRSESPEKIIEEVSSGVPQGKECVKIVDRKEAIKEAIASLSPGEILAVLGRGDETHQEINGEFISLNDKEIILEYLGR